MLRREKMSAVDTAWLRMDRPTNLMMILGVMVFAHRIDFERLRSTIELRLVGRYRRFRQLAVQEVAGAWWQDDPDFDLDAHLKRRALPGKAGRRELQALAGELAVQPLNPAKPLWRFDVIENYAGGSAMVVRIHHSIADGIALVGVILSLTDLAPRAPAQGPARPETDQTPSEDLPGGMLESLAHTLGSLVSRGSELKDKALDLLADRDRLTTYGRHGVGLLAEFVKLLAMPADSATSLKGTTGTVKRVAWSEPIPLGEVKALGKALGCSVNDILLSSVAGALRTYLQQKGESVEGVEVRAMIPVNLRTAGDEGTLGNRFGLGTLSLPLHEGNPFARLYLVRQRMNELKGSYQPPLTLAILAAVGLAPKVVQEQFLDILAAKASTVMTNVPGPKQPLYLAGSRLEQCMFWVPQSGNIGIGVSILSYNDKVQFSLITDRHFVADPQTIAALFTAEFERMLLALLMVEWDAPIEARLAEQQLFGTPPTSPAGAAQHPARRDGKRSAAAGGKRSAAAGGKRSAAAGGKRSAAAGGKPSTAAGAEPAMRGKARGAAATPAAAPAKRVPKRFRQLA